jgi:phosphohistidine phosphatase
MGKVLVLMRHAKAESSAPSDLERRLTDRGHGDAADAGTWLAKQDIVPDYVLVSAAARTQQTWEDVALAAGWDLELAESSEQLYRAGTEEALEMLRETDDGVTTLLVIGHNPTIGQLAAFLDDGSSDDNELDLADGYPTATVTVFDYDGDWTELDEAEGTLRASHVGRG